MKETGPQGLSVGESNPLKSRSDICKLRHATRHPKSHDIDHSLCIAPANHHVEHFHLVFKVHLFVHHAKMLASYFFIANLFNFMCLSSAQNSPNNPGFGHHQQYFRVLPQTSVEVIEGASIIIQCSVGNQAGPVQWAKDGFLLGFNRSIPGYPRFSMVGNAKDGVHNLKIENAQLEDDGEYQCQVGPAPNNKAIRANSKLKVLLKPKSMDIFGNVNGRSLNGSEIQVQQGEKITLQCIVRGGKPSAQIRWYRKENELKLDSIPHQSTSPASNDAANSDHQVVKSEITQTLKSKDNGLVYSCVAVHPALSKPLRKNVSISVLYPPGPPEITGYHSGEILRSGDTLTLTCKSIGGNPLAQLVWYKNDVQVDSSYDTFGNRESINDLRIEIDSSHNNAIYRCEASSPITSRPTATSVRLSVQFAPTKVIIEGPKEARTGDNVTMTCRTDASNPSADMNWVVDGRSLTAINSNRSHPKGGYITTANITLPITSNDRNTKTFSCFAVNRALGATIFATHTLKILYPPFKPSIIGHDNKTTLRAGTLKRITCISQGGNPLASLRWFKASEEITSGYSLSNISGGVASELTINLKDSDNGAAYRCEAKNAATNKPLKAFVHFNVNFAPSKVSIKSTPGRPKAGGKVDLTCESASSNPPAEVTWWHSGNQLINYNEAVVDSSFGGKSTRAVIRLNVTEFDDGSVFICKATHRTLQQSVHDALTLNVRYKPEFISELKSTVELSEGSSSSINMTAKGNPSNIVYRWSKIEGRSEIDAARFIKDGPLLNITRVSRNDSGTYRVEASNSQGTNKRTFKINVNYPATVSKVSDLVLADSGKTAYIECLVDANPITKNMIKWRRRLSKFGDDENGSIAPMSMDTIREITKSSGTASDLQTSYQTPPQWSVKEVDFNRVQQTVEKNRSFLMIQNVTEDDSGEYECVASNGIGKEDVLVANLLVKHKPRIINPPLLSKSASNQGQVGRLVCRAQGAPNVTFQWIREGSIISSQSPLHGPKYRLEPTKQLDLITYQSILYINSVSGSDYGQYDCVARNELGFNRFSIVFNPTSPPDPPLTLVVVNRTSSSVTLKWVPGFDGGSPQSYRIRFQKYEGGDNDIGGADDSDKSSSSSQPPASPASPASPSRLASFSRHPFMYTDVYPKNTTQYTVRGLQDDEEYVFSIMAYNDLGESSYTEDIVKTRTLGESPVSETERVISQVLSGKPSNIPRLIIIAVSALGSCLLLLNVLLVACFVRKRRKKRLEEAEADGSSTAKAATIEMYAPASGSGGSYNNGITETSVSGSDEENKSEAAYSGQTDYAMEISTIDGVNGNQTNIHGTGLSTYLIEDTLSHVNSYFQPHGYTSYVNPVGPDVTVNTYFIDDPHYVDAIRKNCYNQHFESSGINLVSSQTQLSDKPIVEEIKSNGIPPVPPLRSTNLPTFMPRIPEEPLLLNNAQLGHLV